MRRSNLGYPPAPRWATISYVALSTSTSTVASDQIYFVWDSSNGNQPAHSIVSPTHDTTTSYVSRGGPVLAGRQHNHIGPSSAPHWAVISCVALSTSTSTTGASDQIHFVWDSGNGNQAAHTIVLPTHDTTTSYVSRGGPIWAGHQHHIGPPYRM